MENGSQPLIRLDAVSKVFVTDEVETHALQSIHFDVKKGEYLSISGPSGCGKSTLLAILGLLDTPTDGTYYLNGKPVTGLKLSERARIRNREIGFIFRPSTLSAILPSTRMWSCRSLIAACPARSANGASRKPSSASVCRIA